MYVWVVDEEVLPHWYIPGGDSILVIANNKSGIINHMPALQLPGSSPPILCFTSNLSFPPHVYYFTPSLPTHMVTPVMEPPDTEKTWTFQVDC